MSSVLPPSGSPGLFSASDASPLLASLNAEQGAAVALPAEHALILAGAGSGKTRVLTTRIAWLLQTGQVSPGGVLAVTFTNKAAREMMTRLQAMLPVNVRGMWIGTFHGLCNRLLRAHHRTVNLPATFQILDTQDQLSAIKRLCKQFNVDEERFPPKQLAWFIAGCKEEGLRPSMVEARDPDTRKKVELYQLYEEQCVREGVVDFGELLLRSYELLRDNDPVREHYQRRFRHILVDEFQDTNRLQYLWLKLLAGKENCVFAVGDDDQSIYAFRGAEVGNMRRLMADFQVGEPIKVAIDYQSSRPELGAHFVAPEADAEGAKRQWRTVADQLRPKVPKLAAAFERGEQERARPREAGRQVQRRPAEVVRLADCGDVLIGATSIGRSDAVADLGTVRFWGPLAWTIIFGLIFSFL